MDVYVWSIVEGFKTKKILSDQVSHFEFYHHKFHLELPGIELEIITYHDGNNPPLRWRRFCHVIAG